MSRHLWTLALTTVIVALAPPAAGAHPLGNFSINHLTIVEISADRVDVDYALDQAEIPTFQERGLSDETVLARKRDEVRRRLKLIVDGERVALNVKRGASIAHPPGQGGLTLTRVQLSLTAAVEDPRSVEIQDGTFPGRVGWKAIVSRPGEGTAVRASAPSGDPTNGLRSYPQDMLASPIDQRSARFSVRPGSGTLIAPKAVGGTPQTTKSRSGDGFAAVFSDAAAGKGALLFLLLAAFGWGALHALSRVMARRWSPPTSSEAQASRATRSCSARSSRSRTRSASSHSVW